MPYLSTRKRHSSISLTQPDISLDIVHSQPQSINWLWRYRNSFRRQHKHNTEHLLYHRMTIGKHFIFIGTGGRDAESAKTSFQTIRCVMESLRWHNWWQTTSRQTPGESGLCLQWTNPFNDSYCLMYDKYSLSRLYTTYYCWIIIQEMRNTYGCTIFSW